MNTPVMCKNCGMKWLRVTIRLGEHTEFTEDLQYNCPKCGSNWCEPIKEEYTNIITTDGKGVSCAR